jgi:hypothetical protein
MKKYLLFAAIFVTTLAVAMTFAWAIDGLPRAKSSISRPETSGTAEAEYMPPRYDEPGVANSRPLPYDVFESGGLRRAKSRPGCGCSGRSCGQ